MGMQDGYDLTVGTSERGSWRPANKFHLRPYKHLLVAFGGPEGLECHFEDDQSVADKQPEQVFDMYINTCGDQGSRTIRSEEAILISLTYLHGDLSCSGSQKE